MLSKNVVRVTPSNCFQYGLVVTLKFSARIDLILQLFFSHSHFNYWTNDSQQGVHVHRRTCSNKYNDYKLIKASRLTNGVWWSSMCNLMSDWLPHNKTPLVNWKLAILQHSNSYKPDKWWLVFRMKGACTLSHSKTATVRTSYCSGVILNSQVCCYPQKICWNNYLTPI